MDYDGILSPKVKQKTNFLAIYLTRNVIKNALLKKIILLFFCKNILKYSGKL